MCHRTDRPTTAGNIAIVVRHGIVHPSVTVPGLTDLEVTAIKITLASKPVLMLVDYHSPSSPLIGAHMTACFGGGLPVLMARYLNAKHDSKLRLNTTRGNSYVIKQKRTCV